MQPILTPKRRCLAAIHASLSTATAAVMLALLPAGSVSAAPRTALVIGNADYTEISALSNPANDARDVAAKLRELGFDVSYETDLDRRGMEAAIREFGQRVASRKGDALFYYAGHGVERDGRNYLIPVRAGIEEADDLPYKAVDVSQLLGRLESANNGVNIVILDACRNNPYERFRGLAVSGLAPMTGPTGSLIAFATSPGDVASDGEGRNGVFTKHLLKAMSEPGWTLDRTFQHVRREVARETNRKQIPWSNSSVIGDFYFTEAADPGRTSGAPLAQAGSTGGESSGGGDTRFERLDSGDVYDRESGLVWHCPQDRRVFDHKQATKFAYGHRGGAARWRLPTEREFALVAEAGGVDTIPGMQSESFARYWLQEKNRWLGEGSVAQFTGNRSIRVRKQALTGNYKACIVSRR